MDMGDREDLKGNIINWNIRSKVDNNRHLPTYDLPSPEIAVFENEQIHNMDMQGLIVLIIKKLAELRESRQPKKLNLNWEKDNEDYLTEDFSKSSIFMRVVIRFQNDDQLVSLFTNMLYANEGGENSIEKRLEGMLTLPNRQIEKIVLQVI